MTGDENLVHAVVDRLLDNTVKHTPTETKVLVGLCLITGGYRITVEDNGPGIPDDVLDNLFDRFYQVDQARTRSEGSGVGLGLTIAAAIIELHNGVVTASPVASGGLRVTVDLPSVAESRFSRAIG
ncbi:MAG: ATP-binding protein [Gemmatimonadota bacterium]|nr:ATP-binding protein [Gemmatimonadota bacterium]